MPNWVWGAVAGVGGLSLGYGLWVAYRGPTAAPRVESASSPGASPPPPSPDGASAPVSPGTVTLSVDPPAATEAPATGAPCPGCDVVLVTVCSLRRDHVGAYGEITGLTPALDSVASEGYLFSRAYAASNFTLAGLAATLTGRFGSSTGVTGWDKGLSESVPVLPEILGYYGYETGAFTIDAPSGFRPDYGLHRGFQRMEVFQAPRDTPDGRFQPGEIGPGGASAGPVVEWMRSRSGSRPLFAMFHTRTAHFPFVISDEGASDDPTGVHQMLWDAGKVQTSSSQAMPGMAGGTAQQGVVEIIGPDPLQVLVDKLGKPAVEAWREAYADSVARMDIDLQRVIDTIRASGRWDRTVLVVLGDHGESLNDHGELLHGDAYFDGVINVPLAIRVPGMPGKREPIGALVSQADVLPTLLEIVGAVSPAEIDGGSMLPLMRGEAAAIREIALVEGGVAKQIGPHPKGAVIALPFTLLRQQRGCGGAPGQDPPRLGGEPATCLYDVTADPGQTNNIARQKPEVVKELLARWGAFRAARGENAARTLTLDEAFVKELRQTGYDFTQSPR
ncbi:MAG: sulfatase [Deltaproteobacteria bacterium]|nr:sulfatase [Deltaproteobacteria bacterium]